MEVSSITESICKEIHDSCGDNDDEKQIITQTLVNLTQPELEKIRETYKKMYGEDLVQVLSKKFDSSLILQSLILLDPFERDAVTARKALNHNNDNVDYKALIEIFTCRKSSHVLLILQAYHAKYRTNLDTSIANIEPPHPYQKILAALSASHKAHSADISKHIAKCDAKRLYETGEGKGGAVVDECVVVEIFSKRSVAQLKLMFFSYKHIYGHSYTTYLKNRGGFGEFEDALRVVTECICSPPRYFAKVLYECLMGTTIDEDTMARVIVSRAEVDIDEIQKEFKKKYGVELKNVICESFPQGNHRDSLVALATKT